MTKRVYVQVSEFRDHPTQGVQRHQERQADRVGEQRLVFGGGHPPQPRLLDGVVRLVARTPHGHILWFAVVILLTSTPGRYDPRLEE
jgi:hypothetical protein